MFLESCVQLSGFTSNSKYYDITLENSAGVGEPKTCSVEFTSFPCNAGNSTNISSNSPFNISASTCYKYSIGGGSWQVGNWSGSTNSVTYQDCSGAVQTTSVNIGNWTAINVGGACDVYAIFDKTANLQFGAW